jgi:allophanate hydrolase subunit 1
MKFFIPNVDDPKLEQQTYEAIKAFAKTTLGWEVSERRIFSITYTHDGKRQHAEVGKICKANNETVIAILESNAYLICTPTRGVICGMPLLVGDSDALGVQDFD